MNILRRKAGGGFNIKPNKFGGIQRLVRGKTAGYGMGEEIYDNIDKGRKNVIEKLTQTQNHLKVKVGKPRKYISLNL